MKSFPNMVDMKSEKPPDPMGLVGPTEGVDYDYGLCGSFNKESLDKLDLDNDVSAGDYLHIHAFAKVTGIHMKPGSDEIDRVDFCLCHIACEDEDSEGDEDGEY